LGSLSAKSTGGLSMNGSRLTVVVVVVVTVVC